MAKMKTNGVLKNNHGMIFLTIMIAMFIMILTAAMTYQLTSQNVFGTNRLQKSTQALYLAQAGLAHAFASMNAISNATNISSTSLGSGIYSVSVNNVSGRYLVKSTGTVQGVSRVATAEVTLPTTSASAFEYTISSGGSINLDSGTGQSPGAVTGNSTSHKAIYGAGSIMLDGPSSGGYLTIDGNVQAVEAATASSSVQFQNGTLQPHSTTTVVFPAPTLTYYSAIAQANGMYYSGDHTFNSGGLPANPSGGIIYVHGSVTLYGTQNVNGCLVVEGSLNIKKSGNTYPRITITSPTNSNLPAIVCTETANFSSTGNGGAYLTTTGLVYVSGSFNYSSGNHDTLNMTGPLTVKGSVNVSPQSQNSTTFTWANANPPGFTNTNGGGSSPLTITSYNT